MSSDNSSSSSTSYDFTDNPTRDALIDGVLSFMKPGIDHLDAGIEAAKTSQVKLQVQLDTLIKDIDTVGSSQKDNSFDLRPYTDAVASIRSKFTVINNVLQSTHDRLHVLINQVNQIKESNKEKFKNKSSSDLFVSKRSRLE